MFYLLILGSKFNPTAKKAKVTELVFERSLQSRATENQCVMFDKNRLRTLNQNKSTGSTAPLPHPREILTLGQHRTCLDEYYRTTGTELHVPNAFPNWHCAFPGLEKGVLRGHAKGWTVTARIRRAGCPPRDKGAWQH